MFYHFNSGAQHQCFNKIVLVSLVGEGNGRKSCKSSLWHPTQKSIEFVFLIISILI